MGVLLGIGFLAGLITALSPCVLPVLPILLAGGATGGRRRPYAIIAGLVVSFSVFTLFAAWLLDLLDLPQDLLRNVALALLFLLAATLFWPRLGEIIERPLAPLTRRSGRDLGGGFDHGLSLGLVFVPCAGPVLAAVTVLAATQRVDLEGFGLTVAYAAGAAVPMLLIAIGGQRIAGQLKLVRRHALGVRRTLGAVVALTALGIALNVDRHFQTAIPGYTRALQDRLEDTASARDRLGRVTGARAERTAEAGTLVNYGPAPDFQGIERWLNTPAGRPLSLARLRGRVVLVDFWTYSCINCLRTLPYLKAWDETYRDRGLTIVGGHSPEFAFEREPDNVRRAVGRLGVRYPVALDNDFGTWTAYANRYWPAKYLIDRRGRVRYVHFGEGEYAETETLVRRLLGEGELPQRVGLAERVPRGIRTPESYLGYERLARYRGRPIAYDRQGDYRLPATLAPNELALGGKWRVEKERAVAVRDARLRLRFLSQKVYLVLAGTGTVEVSLDGARRDRVRVRGDRLYTLLTQPRAREGLLDLALSPGVAAYAFTFG